MKRNIIYIVIILILAGGAGYYIWNDIKNVQSPNSNTNASPSPSPSPTPSAEPAQIPDLGRQINITANLPEEVKNGALEQIKDISNNLKENPDQVNLWLALGVYYKLLGDYEGAKDAWEYAAAIRPNSSTPFSNLGDLYGYYLKDNKKAEENFLKALENDPGAIRFYQNAYEFYRYVIKNDIKAKAILQKGIELNPSASQDLQNLLDNYYD